MPRSRSSATGSGEEHQMIRLPAVICLLSAVLAVGPLGQDRYTPINPIPLGDTLLTLPTSHIPSEGTWEVKFTHRFNQSLDQGSFSDRVHSLYGLDSNADVGLGLSYAPRRDLQLSFYRSNAMDDIELAAKYVVIQQAQAIPFSAAVRIGGGPRAEGPPQGPEPRVVRAGGPPTRGPAPGGLSLPALGNADRRVVKRSTTE